MIEEDNKTVCRGECDNEAQSSTNPSLDRPFVGKGTRLDEEQVHWRHAGPMPIDVGWLQLMRAHIEPQHGVLRQLFYRHCYGR